MEPQTADTLDPSTPISDRFADLIRPDGEIDVTKLLSAWQVATERLQRTHETLRDEVRRLTDELEIKNRELARKNRLADLGQMASHVAHEVRNSLMPMTLYFSLLKRRLAGDADGRDLLGKIDAGLTALDATVNDLLHFTSDRSPERQTFRPHQLIQDICDGLAAQLKAQDVAVELDMPERLTASADPEMIRRALLNLLLNSLDAMPGGGEVTITACQTRDGLELEVADTGPGLLDPSGDKVFEPFFTTKNDGTGLGLAIVGRIVDVHGGSVTATNCPEGGAAFTLRIPQTEKEAAA